MIRSFCRYLAFRGEQSQGARGERGAGSWGDERRGAPVKAVSGGGDRLSATELRGRLSPTAHKTCTP